MSAARPRVLAVIPARGGSRGLPGKNVRLLAGLPLIVHSIRLARLCPEITRCIVSTDSRKIARVARRHGADVPFLRPSSLARGTTPMWPVLRHALAAVEAEEKVPYDFLLLLDPTSPTRLPSDVGRALRRLRGDARAKGIVSVSVPEFNPVWHCVVENKGALKDFSSAGSRYTRRQQAPRIFRINGLLYIWRASFVRESSGWRGHGRHLIHETPDFRAVSIDTLAQFRRTDALLKTGLLTLPWLG
jgi:CMP-N,N'-diacetyllegionaminic acid synthase